MLHEVGDGVHASGEVGKKLERDGVWVGSASGMMKMHDVHNVHGWEKGRGMVVGKECLVSRLFD